MRPATRTSPLLTHRAAQSFHPLDRERGSAYARQRRVAIAEHSSHGVRARVAGSGGRTYVVDLQWITTDGIDSARAYCECPRFADGVLCKHVWATLLHLDEHGPAPALHGAGAIKVTRSSPGFKPDDESEPDPLDDDDPDGEAEPPRNQQRGDFIPRRADGRVIVRPHTPGARPQGQGNRAHSSGNRPQEKRPEATARWRARLDQLRHAVEEHARWNRTSVADAARPREIWYVVDLASTFARGHLVVLFHQRPVKKSGELGQLKPVRLSELEAEHLVDAEDRELVPLILGNVRHADQYGYGYDFVGPNARYAGAAIRPALYDLLLPRLSATGRFGWIEESGQGRAVEPPRLLTWDGGEPWRFEMELRRDPEHPSERLLLRGRLKRGSESVDVEEPELLLAHGLVLFKERVARLSSIESFEWIVNLRKQGPLMVPVRDAEQLIEKLWQVPGTPQLDLPSDLSWTEKRPQPRPRIRIHPPHDAWQGAALSAEVSFEYAGQYVPAGSEVPTLVRREQRCVIHRDPARETEMLAKLTPLGFRSFTRGAGRVGHFELNPRRLASAVPALLDAGFRVEAEGHKIRRPGKFQMAVSSGTDWFDLSATLDFEGTKVGLPELLAALKRGDAFVTLGDGSRGLLPEDWLTRYAGLAELAEVNGDQLRFGRSQVLLLDALLSAQGEPKIDEAFAQARVELASFEGIQPAQAPATFVGELRHYQQEGLAWLDFLDKFAFGGCLADDMGLGKTIQVLAMLERRRAEKPRAERQPSLVVVPRSLVFNWIEEAGRFTPDLKILDYTGADRSLDTLDQFDLMITTYGTLRRDVLKLKNLSFDYAILDEAQAIKNAASQAAKACRLIQARRRLALSGTPVENHLRELWSIFEFLNPGMLGRSSALAWHTGLTEDGAEDQSGLILLGKALKPFILRRTKEQVLAELPEKTEQTLFCELSAEERARYEDLRTHYRTTLLGHIDTVGIKRSKIQVLEALLRLRQASCHPGLIDATKTKEPSAKLTTLIEQVTEVIEGGHKALVFSQFTSLLAIVRSRLDEAKIPYEYLDGRTRDRERHVRHFQDDPACPLFLISLKAGGQGLNLTAADYVFILDPWWNPAVEAQAVDRAHRIGQMRNVFAYRLIARDTVEEKIVSLQKKKQTLAEAIITADQSLIQSLTAEDLQLLLN